MKKYVLIGIGGALGAIARYLVKGTDYFHYHGYIPLNTLVINITGSFLLALILTIAFEIWEFDTAVRLGIASGFLGAYTTFSTLCKEAVTLVQHGLYLVSLAYMILSAVLGLMAVFLGIILARKVISRLTLDKGGA